MRQTYLILGGGIAGVSAAKAIRERDAEGSVHILSEEEYPPYSRPMLTKASLRTYDPKQTCLYKSEWYEEYGIDLKLGVKVESIAPKEQMVYCEHINYHYDRCIYALGAANFIPPFPGSGRQEICSIRAIDDIYKMKRLAVDARRAVVIGGGVIGLEAALELTKLDLEVTVLETLEYLIPRVLDRQTADKLKNSIPSINILTGIEIKEIGGDDTATYVDLMSGERLSADFMVISCGVRPNTRIAAEAGVHVDGDILVNDYMETNLPGVYACGDCARNGRTNHALWGRAATQGTVAGANAAGGRLRCGVTDTALVFNSRETALFCAGDMGKDPKKNYRHEITESPLKNQFYVNDRFAATWKNCCYHEEKLVGAALIGNLGEMRTLKEALDIHEEIIDEQAPGYAPR